MEDFDKDFSFMRKMFKFIFITALILIISYYVFIVVIGISLVNNPEGVGEFIGTVKKGIESVK